MPGTPVYTKPADAVDEVLTGAIRNSISENDGTPIYTDVIINMTTAVTTAGTDINAARINLTEHALEALDIKVAGMEIDAAIPKTTPVDTDRFGFFDAESDPILGRAYITWAQIKAILSPAVADVAAAIHAATAKGSIDDADELGISNSTGGAWDIGKVLFSTVKSTLKTYFDTLYQPLKANLTTLAGLSSIANLTAIANLASTANKVPYITGTGTAALTGIWIQVPKTANQSIQNNGAVFPDPELVCSIPAGKIVAIRGKVSFDTVAAADFRFKLFTSSAGAAFRGMCRYMAPGATAFVNVNYVAAPPSPIVVTGGTTGGYVEWNMLVQGVAAGAFAFCWAQGTSNAGFTTVLGGSYLEYMIVN